MKVVIVGPVYPFRGGIAYFAGCLAKELEKEKHQVLLINFRNQYPGILFPGKKQTEEEEYFSDIRSVRVLTPYNPFTFKTAWKEISRFDPDCVIFSFFLPFFVPAYNYLLGRIKKNKKIKSIILAHNITFHEKWIFSKSLTKILLRRADYVLTLSNNVYTDARHLINGTSSKSRKQPVILEGFHPLYDFHNRNRFTQEEAKESLDLNRKTVILFFGYIKPYKGLDLLIGSFPLIKEALPEAVLLIVGEVYGSRDYYDGLIEETGMSKDIIFKDKYVGSDEVELYFKSADVLVLPYRQATQSGVIQTAYVMDLGVVVTPVGGLPEMIVPGKTGIIASSVTEEAIASAVVQYCSLDKEKVKQSIEELKEKYSWRSFVRFLVTELQKTSFQSTKQFSGNEG